MTRTGISGQPASSGFHAICVRFALHRKEDAWLRHCESHRRSRAVKAEGVTESPCVRVDQHNTTTVLINMVLTCRPIMVQF
jgi:hypothetical protein